jgi:hypothetical protein
VYVYGLPRSITSNVDLAEGDQVEVVINRSKNNVIFMVNSVEIDTIDIPPHLQQARLYPFLELHSEDWVKLKASVKR